MHRFSDAIGLVVFTFFVSLTIQIELTTDLL